LERGVESHVSLTGSYLPPVFSSPTNKPPHTIMRLPVHTAEWWERAVGAFTVLMEVQESEMGSYFPPVEAMLGSLPPHTSMCVPLQTAEWPVLPVGLPVTDT